MASLELEPIGGLTDQFRIDLAKGDLAHIAALADEQLVVQDHALRAANEVMQVGAQLEVPNQEVVNELTERFASNRKQTARPNMNRGNALRQIIGAMQIPDVKVDDVSISRDLLAALHPDRTITSGNTLKKDEELFKKVTEAQQYEDVAATQTLYASAVASGATLVDTPTPELLEKTRYKAYMALQAGKGRFGSTKEIDAWAERETELLPHKIRAGLLGQATNLFAVAMGADHEGRISIPKDYYEDIMAGLDASNHALEAIFDEDKLDAEKILGADLKMFDANFADFVGIVSGMLKLSQLGGPQTNQFAVAAAKKLKCAAQALENYREPPTLADVRSIGFLAVSGMLGEKPPNNPDLFMSSSTTYKGSKERYIISDDERRYYEDEFQKDRYQY